MSAGLERRADDLLFRGECINVVTSFTLSQHAKRLLKIECSWSRAFLFCQRITFQMDHSAPPQGAQNLLMRLMPFAQIVTKSHKPKIWRLTGYLRILIRKKKGLKFRKRKGRDALFKVCESCGNSECLQR